MSSLSMCPPRILEPLASTAQLLHSYSSHQAQQDIHSTLFSHFLQTLGTTAEIEIGDLEARDMGV